MNQRINLKEIRKDLDRAMAHMHDVIEFQRDNPKASDNSVRRYAAVRLDYHVVSLLSCVEQMRSALEEISTIKCDSFMSQSKEMVELAEEALALFSDTEEQK